MASDVSYWRKFLQESDLTIDDEVLDIYSQILSEKFSSIEELLTIDDNDLVNLGIDNKLDCENIIKHARIIDEKDDLPIIRQSAASNSLLENWHRHSQSTPLNPKSKCSLSPALVSRISYNDTSSLQDESSAIKKCHFEHIIETPERTIVNNLSMVTPTCSKKTPPTSVPGMRIMKSISDTISIQKKILMGHDRLKRLTLTKSMLKRQTSLVTKKLINLKDKFRNPFNKIKAKPSRLTADQIQIVPSNILIEKSIEHMQNLTLNTNDQYLKLPIQTLPNRKFKLGTPTTFLNRSIANNVHFA